MELNHSLLKISLPNTELEKCKTRGGGEVFPYKGLMGPSGRAASQGMVFGDFCLKQGIKNRTIFVLNKILEIGQFLS